MKRLPQVRNSGRQGAPTDARAAASRGPRVATGVARHGGAGAGRLSDAVKAPDSRSGARTGGAASARVDHKLVLSAHPA